MPHRTLATLAALMIGGLALTGCDKDSNHSRNGGTGVPGAGSASSESGTRTQQSGPTSQPANTPGVGGTGSSTTGGGAPSNSSTGTPGTTGGPATGGGSGTSTGGGGTGGTAR